MPPSSRPLDPMLPSIAVLISAEPERAGVAVDQRDAVQEEAGAEGAEQEVLHRGFLAEQPATTREPAEQVERQRQDLERDEHREQVVGRREQQHAADGEHQQRVDLGVLQPAGGCLALGLGARQRGGLAGEGADAAVDVSLGEQEHAGEGEHQDQAPEEDRRPVDGDRALGRDLPDRVVTDLVEAERRPRSSSRRPRRARAIARSVWVTKRSRRGANASTSTPAQATPSTMRSGDSSKYSIVGLTKSFTRGPLPQR